MEPAGHTSERPLLHSGEKTLLHSGERPLLNTSERSPSPRLDPEAVHKLHREFLRAGTDVMQAFTFYASEYKLTNRGNKAGVIIGVEMINRETATLAREVRRWL